jgi:hypothetical protein
VKKLIVRGLYWGYKVGPQSVPIVEAAIDRIIAEFRKETPDKFAAGLTCANRVTAGDT